MCNLYMRGFSPTIGDIESDKGKKTIYNCPTLHRSFVNNIGVALLRLYWFTVSFFILHGIGN